MRPQHNMMLPWRLFLKPCAMLQKHTSLSFINVLLPILVRKMRKVLSLVNAFVRPWWHWARKTCIVWHGMSLKLLYTSIRSAVLQWTPPVVNISSLVKSNATAYKFVVKSVWYFDLLCGEVGLLVGITVQLISPNSEVF